MLIRSALLLTLLFSYSILVGQEFSDSLKLEEIKVYGVPLMEYATGSKVIDIDSAALEINESSTINNLLAERSPLYFKTYGTGIATIAFRGTSASHTAVLWNGININSASLGQADFSTIPVSASENIALHFGSSSSLFGSGAIGGSVQLFSIPDWSRGFEGNFRQEIGSFGRIYTSLAAKYGNGNLEGKTNLFYKTAENNFPYEVKGINGIETVRQENAAVKQYGVIQDLNYRIASNQYIAVNFWANYVDREIQPSITASSSRDQQIDQSIRIVANYHLNNRYGHLNPRVAYVYDILEFNQSPSTIYKYIAALQHEYRFNSSLKVSAGVDFTHLVADVSGYGSEVKEDRTDIFTLIKYSPWKKLLVSANIRQSFISGFSAPLSPSLGFQYTFLSSKAYALSWKGSASKSYRIPTLNDRYWSPGGNPELKAETGKNIETGLHFIREYDQNNVELEITGFTNYVDDWIIWNQHASGSYWYPENINKVHARGVEISSEYTGNVGMLAYSMGLQYAYTKSTNNVKEDKNYGRQLMYVPLHTGALYLRGTFLNCFFRLNTTYTHSRYTTIEELEPFWLADLTVGRNISLGSHSVSAFLRINNVLNKDYVNYESIAMPGRNYNISLKYSFNNKN